MTFSTVDYNKLPGFSKLFLDFINGGKFFDERFPNNKKLLDDKNFLSQKSLSNQNRNILNSVISSTMSHLNLNDKQENNLKLLNNQNTLAVVTGQQVGFLGGPLYSLYKALSAVALSEKLKMTHKDFSFIPVFWIEDNDHDNLESSQITIHDKNYNPIILNCDESPDKNDRRVVSSRYFDSYISSIIDRVISTLSEFSTDEKITNELKKIYSPSKSWTSAFVEIMNYLIGSTGIIFISASNLQKSGIFYPLVKHEIENPQKSNDLIQAANSLLESNHYHIQAKTSKVNLFFHKENSRYKIEPIDDNPVKLQITIENYNLNELLNVLSLDPTVFSPNVLLRPVFQDFALPTAAYVAGPSEIGYCSQIREVYDFFGVIMPAFIPRHSVTFIDKKIGKFLLKNNLSPEYFFAKKENLKTKIADIFNDKNTDEIINRTKKEIQNIFEKLKNYSKEVDPTLEATVNSATSKTEQLIETIGKKIISAGLRNQNQIVSKYYEAGQFFYPFDTFQERIFSPINLILQSDSMSFTENIMDVFRNDPKEHFLIVL